MCSKLNSFPNRIFLAVGSHTDGLAEVVARRPIQRFCGSKKASHRQPAAAAQPCFSHASHQEPVEPHEYRMKWILVQVLAFIAGENKHGASLERSTGSGRYTAPAVQLARGAGWLVERIRAVHSSQLTLPADGWRQIAYSAPGVRRLCRLGHRRGSGLHASLEHLLFSRWGSPPVAGAPPRYASAVRTSLAALPLLPCAASTLQSELGTIVAPPPSAAPLGPLPPLPPCGHARLPQTRRPPSPRCRRHQKAKAHVFLDVGASKCCDSPRCWSCWLLPGLPHCASLCRRSRRPHACMPPPTISVSPFQAWRRG